MRHTPGFYRRLTLLALQNDLVRGGICLLLMVVLLVWGLPLWLALILPVLAYAGLRLIISSVGQPQAGTGQLPAQPQDGPAAYEICFRLQEEIKRLADQVSDDTASEQLRRITSRIDKTLGAIAEDNKHQAAIPLLDLVRPTNDLLAGYLKVVRRGFDQAATHVRVRENLSTIEAGCERFWVQLNREAIVNLEKLSATIDFNLEALTGPREHVSLPPNQPEHVTDELVQADERADLVDIEAVLSAADDPVASLPRVAQNDGPSLTPRELDVLRLLVAGRTDQEIADALFLARRTATSHVTSILAKLDVVNRTEAAAVAVRKGLV